MGYEWDDVNGKIKGVVPTLDEYKNKLFESTNGNYALEASQLSMSNAMRDGMTIAYNGITLTQAQFAGVAGDISQMLYELAVKSEVMLVDEANNVLTSAAMIATALQNQTLNFAKATGQMLKLTVEDAQKAAQAIAKLFSFAGGFTPYRPTMPTFSGGGGSGGSSAESAEKKAIDASIKSLENKKKALQDQIKVFKKYIDAQKESLKLIKEEKEFSDDLLKKNMSLAKLKAEIVILALDDSEEAKAQRLKLEEDAANMEVDIKEFTEDRKYDLQVEALDKVQQQFEDGINKQIDGLNATIEKYREQSSAIKENTGSVGGLTAGIKAFGEAGTFAVNDVINKLKEQGVYLDDANVGIRTMIQSWIDQGLAIDEVTEKANIALARLAKFHVDRAAYEQSRFEMESAYHNGGMVEVHHNGAPAFVGGLKSNEVFAKLMAGEVVVNEPQMDNFINRTLPEITSNSSGNITIDMPINVAGNLDKTVLPDLKNIANNVITEINKTMNGRGYLRNTTTFGG